MLKKIICLALILGPFSVFAEQTNHCAHKSLKKYISTGVQNDYGPFVMTLGEVIPAGVEFSVSPRITLDAQEEDTILFQYKGSQHSGFFQDGVLVRASDCKVLSIFNIYAE